MELEGPTGPPASRHSAPSHRLTFGVLALALASFGILQSLVIPALPTLERELHTSVSGVSWILTAYLVSASVLTPIIGRVGDMAGRRNVFVFAVGALAVGSLLAALSSSLVPMIVARVIQGTGGGVLPLTFAILREELPASKVAGSVGIATGVTTGAAGLGVVVGGPIVSNLNYHWLFWIPMVLTGVAALASFFVIPQTRARPKERINVSAAILLAGCLVGILIGISQGPVWGWQSPRTVVLLLGGIVLGVVWFTVEARASTPLVDVRMMRQRAVWTGNVSALLIGVVIYASGAFIPAFVQTPRSVAGYGFSASISASGFLLLYQTIGMFVGCMQAGRMFRLFGIRAVLAWSAVGLAASFVMLALARASTWQVALAMSLSGITGGLLMSAAAASVVEAVRPEDTGVASGMNANFRTIGGALGVATIASILNTGGKEYPPAEAYTSSFLFLAASGLLVVAPAYLMRRTTVVVPEPAVGPLLVASEGDVV